MKPLLWICSTLWCVPAPFFPTALIVSEDSAEIEPNRSIVSCRVFLPRDMAASTSDRIETLVVGRGRQMTGICTFEMVRD